MFGLYVCHLRREILSENVERFKLTPKALLPKPSLTGTGKLSGLGKYILYN